jgi:hypothetical protein
VDDDRARRVALRELADRRGGAPRVDLARCVHDEVQHGRARDDMPLLGRVRALHASHPRELALERGDARGRGAPEVRVDVRGGGHGLLTSFTAFSTRGRRGR